MYNNHKCVYGINYIYFLEMLTLMLVFFIITIMLIA